MKTTYSSSSSRNNRCYSSKQPTRRSSPTDCNEKFDLQMNEIQDKTILNRITWFDANLVLNELYDNNITVNKTAIKIKSKIQSNLYDLGLMIQKNAGLILFVGILIFLTTSVGIKTINYENNFENLWVEGKFLVDFYELINK